MKCYLCDKNAPKGDPPLCEACRPAQTYTLVDSTSGPVSKSLKGARIVTGPGLEVVDGPGSNEQTVYTVSYRDATPPDMAAARDRIIRQHIADSERLAAKKGMEFARVMLSDEPLTIEGLKTAEDDMAARTCRTCGYMDCGRHGHSGEAAPMTIGTNKPGSTVATVKPNKWLTAGENQWVAVTEAGDAKRQFVETNAAACARCGAIATVIEESDGLLTIGCLVGRYEHFTSTCRLEDGLASAIRSWNARMADERHRRANRGE